MSLSVPRPFALIARAAFVLGALLWLTFGHASAQIVTPAPVLAVEPSTRAAIMTAEAIIAISALVVTITQLLKWLGLRDRWGAVVVLAFSLIGVVAYQISFAPDGRPFFLRTDLWPALTAWVAVATSAAGVFGFTRSTSDAVTATKSPPPGAAQQPVVKAD